MGWEGENVAEMEKERGRERKREKEREKVGERERERKRRVWFYSSRTTAASRASHKTPPSWRDA